MAMFSALLFIGCLQRKEDFNVKGLWRVITKDSIYNEVIFTNDRFWMYDENAGAVSRMYSMTSDSLYLYRSKTEGISFSLRISQREKNSFIASNSEVRFQYERLDVLIDTSELLSNSEKALDEYLFNGLKSRRRAWLNGQK
jgi:hypothetical protein